MQFTSGNRNVWFWPSFSKNSCGTNDTSVTLFLVVLMQTLAYTSTYSMQLKAVREKHVDMYQFDKEKDHVMAS